MLLGIQILQYEFLGPVPLNQWGPPMEKLLYLVMSRDKDRFSILYGGNCEKTDEKSFFVQHDRFKCWMQHAGSEESLYLAILPMFDSDAKHRRSTLARITAHYKPPCNAGDAPAPSPEYAVRRDTPPASHSCPCCGSAMKPEKALKESTLFRCAGCGMSDTRLSS